PVLDGLALGPARRAQAAAQLVELVVADLDAEGLDRRRHRVVSSGEREGAASMARRPSARDASRLPGGRVRAAPPRAGRGGPLGERPATPPWVALLAGTLIAAEKPAPVFRRRASRDRGRTTRARPFSDGAGARQEDFPTGARGRALQKGAL